MGEYPSDSRSLSDSMSLSDSGESFCFERIRMNLADLILPADSLMGNAVFDRDIRNDEMPAFRGLISGVECSSHFAAPGDVSRIV